MRLLICSQVNKCFHWIWWHIPLQPVADDLPQPGLLQLNKPGHQALSLLRPQVHSHVVYLVDWVQEELLNNKKIIKKKKYSNSTEIGQIQYFCCWYICEHLPGTRARGKKERKKDTPPGIIIMKRKGMQGKNCILYRVSSRPVNAKSAVSESF